MNKLRIYGWGYNEESQLGICQSNSNDPQENISVNCISNVPFEVTGLRAGESHSLMLSRQGDVFGMGSNQNGQLGFNKSIESIGIPTQIFFGKKLVMRVVECGSEHSMAITDDNHLYGWGLNLKGQLGTGDCENRMEPVRIDLDGQLRKSQNGREQLVDIKCGAIHSVLVTNQNRGFACGYNNTYALCQQDQLDSNTFIQVNQLKEIATDEQISVRCGMACTGFLADNKLYLQGLVAKQRKQLQFKSLTCVSQSVQIVDFDIGNYFLVCRDYQGDVYTMGDNLFGQLAMGQSVLQTDRLHKVEGLPSVTHVSLGSNHVFAVGHERVFAWGNNEQNQISQSSHQTFYSPQELSFLKPSDIHIIACGDFHTLCTSFKPLSLATCPQDRQLGLPEEEKDMVIFKQKRENEQMYNKLAQLQNELAMQKVELNQEKIKCQYTEQKLKETQHYQGGSKGKDVQTQWLETDTKVKKNPKLPEPRQFNISLEIKFNELKLEQQIGEGGYGKIYQGKWRELTVAVKMLKPAAINEVVIRDFLSECKAMETFRHPNICMFLGACTSPPNFALVLEYCSRGSLMNLIQNKEITLNWDDKKRLALETCRALNYLHAFDPPILHRDLKSLNLLVDEFFRIKLADFGWTKILDNYMTGKIGTYQWMAPEVIQMYNYTEKADVYSFGIILWEIAAREPPFRNISGSNVAKEVIANDLRPTIPERVPKNLQKLIRRCWDRDPAARPGFKEIIRELESFKF